METIVESASYDKEGFLKSWPIGFFDEIISKMIFEIHKRDCLQLLARGRSRRMFYAK